MFKRFKERVSDWMFEEIEEDDFPKQKVSHTKQTNINLVDRNRRLNTNPTTKIKYKYPKYRSEKEIAKMDDKKMAYFHKRKSHPEKMKKIQEIPTFMRRK